MISAMRSAISPETPVSISSNTMVGSLTAPAIIALMESMTRAISPPEATEETLCNVPFLFAETRIFVTGLKLSPGSGILYNKAVYDFGTDAWNAISPSASYFSAEQDLSEFVNRTGIDQWGYKKSAVDVSSNTDATALFSEKEALYFIPVNNQNGTAKEGDLSLKISYDVVTKVLRQTVI